MRRPSHLAALSIAFVLLAACPRLLVAQETPLPAPLEPWRSWVLHGEEHRACPVLNGSMPGPIANHICAWPSPLEVDAAQAEARFTQIWTVHAEAWIPLPGDTQQWPVEVLVNGEPEPAVLRAGRPSLLLTEGSFEIAGRIPFAGERPASLTVPAETAVVTLTLDDVEVARPALDGGVLWLGLRPEAAVDEDRLELVVHRRLVDALPMQLETRVEFDVAGQRREVMLEGATLPGFVPMHLDAPFPAQLTNDGRLRVQLRPGRWVLTLTARAPAMLATVARNAALAPWPVEEVWSFESVPRLRVAALEGAAPVDASRSGVPQEWLDLPAFRVAAGDSVSIVERSRTDAQQANRLLLERHLWLDFDGDAYTTLDRISGTLWSGWRLDMAPPYTMTMASQDGDSQLITLGETAGTQGVEVRAHRLALRATARVASSGVLPVTGYLERFDDVTTTLHVPPGYRVLAALGADEAYGVWLEAWSLLDIFLLLVIGVATWRLFGPAAGSVALLALVLIYHEPWAPRWPWLNLLAAVALVRVAPATGRLASAVRSYRWASVALVLVLLVPFSAQQLRNALFPQLEMRTLGRGVDVTMPAPPVDAVAQAPAAALIRRGYTRDTAEIERARESSAGSSGGAAAEVSRYQPGALVQTGPGLPDWTWTAHRLRFAGPVDPADTVRLITIGPALVSLWRIAGVVFAVALLLWLVAGGLPRIGRGAGRPARHLGASAAAVVALAAGIASPPSAHAQTGEIPSPALLEELRARLTEPAPCRPNCAEATRAEVVAASDRLRIELVLAAQADTAVPIPGTASGWRPTDITVNDERVARLFRDGAGTAWIALPAGVHRVVLSGAWPAGATVSVPFPLPPRSIAVDAAEFEVAGVVNGRLLSGTLELTRLPTDADGDGAADDDAAANEAIGPSAISPFVTVVRRVTFDIDWRVTTEVTRIAPRSGAFTVDVTLLPNESVLTPGIEVANGRAAAAFEASARVVRWESRLPVGDTLTLTAPEAAPWTETWQLAVSPIWHAETSGVPSSVPESVDAAFYVPEFIPRRGETLTVDLRRPAPASGDTIAFDEVNYDYSVGARTSSGRLHLRYRSTRGMQHRIVLPEGALLESVTINGAVIPLELDGRVLGVPVTPGEHRAEIVWRMPEGTALRTVAPSIELGAGAGNVDISMTLPGNRWVLMTLGPRVGPAVLYWPELLALVLAAWALGRLAWSPLRTHEWLVLGIGLSTFAWPVLGLFAVWAFVMSWRARRERPVHGWRFNTLQVAIGLLTVTALTALVAAIPLGLLGRPDMHLVSPVPFGGLDWFIDRVAGTIPAAGVISVSLWFYKAAMLAWALWLSFALLRWLPWAWHAFVHGGAWDGRVTQPAA